MSPVPVSAFLVQSSIELCGVLMQKASPAPAASKGAELSLFHLLYAAIHRLSLQTKKTFHKGLRLDGDNNSLLLYKTGFQEKNVDYFINTQPNRFSLYLAADKCMPNKRLPAARIYSDPFPGCISKLLTSVPTGRAPSGYASPSLADTAA